MDSNFKICLLCFEFQFNLKLISITLYYGRIWLDFNLQISIEALKSSPSSLI